MSKGKEKLSEDTSNLPWVEKYRPRTLDDVYGQTDVVATVRKYLESSKLPHLLFYGPPGTGKTSTIGVIARQLYGDSYRRLVLELNASDDRGIDVVRDQIKIFASTGQMFAKGFKLVILDEADSMTNAAQNALRRIIEKYTAHTRFCILANYTHKLIPALVSRCTRFRFSPLPSDAVRARALDVMDRENMMLSPEALQSLVKLSCGDMRRVLNVLQACKAATDEGREISEPMIYDCVGAPQPQDIRQILDAIMTQNWPMALSSIDHIKKSKGLALADLITCIFDDLAELELKESTRKSLLRGLSEIEWRLSTGGNERIQTSAVIGVVKSSLDLEAVEN